MFIRCKLRFAAVVLCSMLLSACSSSSSQSLKKNPDPYEGFNRTVFTLNDFLIRYVGRPMVRLYQSSVPQGARNGVQSFFDNIGTVSAIANDVLQLNPRLFVHHSIRLVLNTTLGIFGFVDVATQAGFQPITQSFGLTLAGWGYETSAYLVLPFYGPSTVRDGMGLVPDFFMSPISYVYPERDRYLLGGANLMQTMAQQVPRYDTITNVALDPYVGVRNAYLQKQKNLINQIKLGGLEVELDLLSGPPAMPSDEPEAAKEKPPEEPETDWANIENFDEF